MKTVIIIIMLALAAPVMAATETADTKTDATKEQSAGKAQTDENAAKETKNEAAAEKKAAPGEFSCKYYTVVLPDGWKAIRAPEERQGLVYAIFANNSGSAMITLIVGPRKGADAALIAGMFADQFKALKAPVEKNGRYIFNFMHTDTATQKKMTATASVGVYGDDFMLASYMGKQKEIQQFLKNNLKGAEDYVNLMPQ